MQARYEAFAALARRHPAEYQALYEAELAHLRIEAPPGHGGRHEPVKGRFAYHQRQKAQR